jgi:hypothetical protein
MADQNFWLTPNITVPVYASDPTNPKVNDGWVLQKTLSFVGSPIGLLSALTYATTVYQYKLSVQVTSSQIVRTVLS